MSEVRGLKYALDILEQIPQEFKGRNSVVSRALKKTAKRGREMVKAQTPVKTGRLQRAVSNTTLRASRNDQTLNLAVVVRPGKNRKDTRGAFYRLIVEKRQPYFRPAIRAFAVEALQSFPKDLSDTAERLKRRYNRTVL